MGWERREGKEKKYYTRTERRGKGRKRIYYGAGALAEIASLFDAMLRIERETRKRMREGRWADLPDPRPG